MLSKEGPLGSTKLRLKDQLEQGILGRPLGSTKLRLKDQLEQGILGKESYFSVCGYAYV